MSPEEYTRLKEIEEDYFPLLEANKRMKENGNSETLSFISIMHNLGIRVVYKVERVDGKVQ